MRVAALSSWKNRIVGEGVEAAGQLLANPKNWRIHPQEQQAALEGVLSEVGWVQRVVVNRRTGYVVDGHLRVHAALKQGDETPVPVVYVDLSEDEEAEILATLDPLSAMAVADKAKLDELLREVASGDVAVQEMLAALAADTGLKFDGEATPDPAPEIDRAEELRQKWGVERGQVWEIGRHAVACADSLNDEFPWRCELAITDPPYDLDAADVRRVFEQLGVKRAGVLTAQKQAFALCSNGWEFSLDLVWRHRTPRSFNAKTQPIFYHSNVLYMHQAKAKIGWLRPSMGFGSVIEVEENEYPVTAMGQGKARSLFVEIMRCVSGDEVIDPFLGSGTTLLAAELLDRRCCGAELDPCMVAVTLDRARRAGLSPMLSETRIAAASQGSP